MKVIEEAYEKMGICREVVHLGQLVNESLKERFEEIDKVAEINQLKVLKAMQDSKVSEGCLYPSTGEKLLNRYMQRPLIRRMLW